jgi:hypothetical protein
LQKVGIIGVGKIGGSLLVRLAESGDFDLSASDVHQEQLAVYEKVGVHTTTSNLGGRRAERPRLCRRQALGRGGRDGGDLSRDAPRRREGGRQRGRRRHHRQHLRAAPRGGGRAAGDAERVRLRGPGLRRGDRERAGAREARGRRRDLPPRRRRDGAARAPLRRRHRPARLGTGLRGPLRRRPHTGRACARASRATLRGGSWSRP